MLLGQISGGNFIKYSWHKEFYDKAMKTIVKTSGVKLEHFHDWYGEQPVGWLEYFETNHPELYKKYTVTMERIIALWGKKDPESMEAWKTAVKLEIEATQWAMDNYIEHQKKILNGEAQPELEALVD